MSRSVPPDVVVDYPCSDDQPMAESEFQLVPMLYVLTVLRTHFRRRENVYVGGDMFVYYEEGNPGAVVAPDVCVGSLAAPKTEASSSRSGVRPRSGAPPRARSSRPGTPDGPCDTAPRYESPHPPRDRKGFTDWQSFAPPQRDRPAATVVYFCTAAYIDAVFHDELRQAFEHLGLADLLH